MYNYCFYTIMRFSRSSALSDAIEEVFFKANESSSAADAESVLDDLHEDVVSRLFSEKKRVGRAFGLKFQVRLQVKLRKYSEGHKKYIVLDVWFPSDSHTISQKHNILKEVGDSFRQIVARYDAFVHQGSGWSLRRAKKLSLTCSSFPLIRGGCRKRSLPLQLSRSKAVISLQDQGDNFCFAYAVAAAIANKSRNATRKQTALYHKLVKLMPKVLSFPVKVCDLRKFERDCPQVSINVYGFKGNAFPYYISGKKRALHADLLLYANHFYPVRNLSSLVKKQRISNRRKGQVCKGCLAHFVNKGRYTLHQQLCNGSGPRINLPEVPEDAKFKFTNFPNMFPAPFVMYCDLETFIMKEEKIEHKKLMSTRKHCPISAAAVTVCRSNPKLSSKPFLFTGEDCISVFLTHIQEEFARVENILTNIQIPMEITASEESIFQATECCLACHVTFSKRTGKVRDHDHLSGKFRGALCNRCNLSFAQTRREVYIFFHGLSNYDSHFLIQEIHKFARADKIRIIPRSGEKYLAFSIQNAHFKDSYQFLGSSLAELASNLFCKGAQFFTHVNRFVQDPNRRQFFFKKGVFPYSYFDSPEKLKEKQLPDISCFKNDLTNADLDIESYEQAQRVWQVFECNTLQDYLEVYLLCDVLLLADVFESFRNNCITDYLLDPVYYFSAPHFTLDAFLLKGNIQLDLLMDINQYIFLTGGIRGGLSMVCGRYSYANNKLLPTYFDESKPEKYILYFDANNLYGKAMMECLPTNNFEWMSEEDLKLENILALPDDGLVGCIFECDILYPSELFADHSDYPLAPHKVKIPFSKLSPVAQDICKKHGLKHSTNTEKLMATFLPKNRYTIHYRNAKLYSELGLQFVKIHRGVKFQQAPIIKSYIEFNSKKRAESTNNFDISFYKLLSNALFGKTIERPEKHCKVVLASSPERHQKLVSDPCYKESKIINENLVGVTMGYPAVQVKKPFYLGVSILELAKYHMYSFHYKVMKAQFGKDLRLLYTDTDSLIYEICQPDVYSKLKDLAPYFDFSNYPKSHILYSSKNKRVPGLFKDETAGEPITEFVGLRSKMYSFQMLKDEELKDTKTAKGVKRSVVERELSHNDFKRCLFENIQMNNDFHQIRSKKHNVMTTFQNKVSLSPFDDKRYLLSPTHSVPYGSASKLC